MNYQKVNTTVYLKKKYVLVHINYTLNNHRGDKINNSTFVQLITIHFLNVYDTFWRIKHFKLWHLILKCLHPYNLYMCEQYETIFSRVILTNDLR